jgi:hypothetical protein
MRNLRLLVHQRHHLVLRVFVQCKLLFDFLYLRGEGERLLRGGQLLVVERQQRASDEHGKQNDAWPVCVFHSHRLN